MAQALGLGKPMGVVISESTKGGPAEKAGLKRGDVVLEFNGKKVSDTVSLRNMVVETKPGSRAVITIVREGKQKQVTVELGELPVEEVARAETREKAVSEIGIEVQTLTPSLASKLGYEGEEGVVVTSVKGGSPAQTAGIAEGDLVTEVNKEKVKTVSEYETALAKSKPGEAALFLIKRENATLFVAVRVPK